MMELKCFYATDGEVSEIPFKDGFVYPKEDVDRHIAELQSENQLEIDEWYKKLMHQKYKRCLAMADLCFRECQTYRALIERGEEHFSKMDFYGRWNKIWLILAEKFKEAK